MTNNNRNFVLSYPYTGSVVHSNSFKNAIKQTYREFKSMNDINDGLFGVTDLDKNIEYQFRASNGQLLRTKKIQFGGNPSDINNDLEEIHKINLKFKQN